MYSLSPVEHNHNLCFNDLVIWYQMSVVVCLDDGSEQMLEPGDGENEFVLGDQLSVRFTLQTYGQRLALSVSARIHKGISWPSPSWHPLKAISVRIESLGYLSGVCAHYLYNSWWTRPHFDRAISSLPTRTQSLLWETGDQYRHMISFCDEELRSEIAGNGSDGLQLIIAPQKAGVRSFHGTVLIAGIGDDPYQLIHDNVALGRERLTFACYQRERRTLPDIFHYLGWCSWDACYHDVDEQSVLAKAQEFQKKGVPVKWMLVDDGWSIERERRLLSFCEDRNKFPNGFRGLKDKLVSQYGIPWLGAWHSLSGHWEGIDRQVGLPGSEPLDDVRSLPPVDFEAACGFWFRWHDYLACQGVDFIKVDGQSNLANHYRYREFPGYVSRSAHQALEASAAMYFNGQLINCMGMAVDQLWNRPISALSRNSDDFFPDVGHNLREFALQNAYNALFHDAFFQGDWDMWWSDHPDADAHALLRAVSGGPIYTSDKVGRTHSEKIMQLTFNDGRIVRCDGQGKVCRNNLFAHPGSSGRLLKIWNRVGGVGVLALLNIADNEQELTESVDHSCVEGLAGDDWLAYRVRSEFCVPGRELLPVTLPADGSELVLFYPDTELFCLGLANMLLPPCALLDQFISSSGGQIQLHIHLKQGGNLLIYSRLPIDKIRINAQEYNWTQHGNLHRVSCPEWRDDIRVEVLVSS